MIKKIEHKHIPQVAKIHKENLPSFLTAFPLSFIEKFYKAQLTKEQNLFIGSFEGDRLEGFVFGTDHVDELYNSFIAENKLYFLRNVARTFLLHPRYLLLFSAKFFKKAYVSDCKRQLVYITIDKKIGKKGIGSKLLHAFDESWKKFGYYELEVESDNPAFNFYKKNGFFTIHESNNWIEKKILMGKNL